MYKVLCKFLVSMLFSFELTHHKAEKPKTRKLSGRRDITSTNKGNVCTPKCRQENFPLKWHIHRTSVPEIDGMENSTSTHERTILRPKSSPETTDEIYTSTHGRIHAKTMFWFINQERSRAIKLMDECKVLH